MMKQSGPVYEPIQENLAMIKMLKQSEKDINQGKVHDVKSVLVKLRERRAL